MSVVIDDLRGQIKAKLEEASGIAKACEDGNRDFTPEERMKVTALFDEAKSLKAKLDEKTGDASLKDALTAFSRSLVDPKGTPDPKSGELPGLGGTLTGAKSLGERFTDDEGFKS